MNKADHIYKSLKKFLRVIILIFFDQSRIQDPESFEPGSGLRDGQKLDPGSVINIPDPSILNIWKQLQHLQLDKKGPPSTISFFTDFSPK
jgi:hypothetical protein